ncbi:zonular occludens toxin family protein [Eikenella longinqua]|uniref:Zonular occludens toxin family protein n=2 Tax=Eikenella longinqua TaxID=1795827 RepID=A0A1A9RXS7_9NEIS|nr:zonular occludens toxin family protein [Eikenella longinqua]
METWHQWAPDGSILVIDEAQRVFRPRPAGAKVPDYIQALETHRHKGIDIFVLTQHPRLIDVHLRSLIGEHRNISRTMLGLRRVSYWQRCANPEARADVAEAKNSIFLPKKSVFGMYKSASEHTKLKGSVSAWVYALPVIIVIVGYLMSYVWASYQRKIHPEQAQAQQVEQYQQQPQNYPQQANGQYPATGSYAEQPATVQQPPDNNLKSEDWQPAIDGQPWTAPIYNGHNRNIQTMPYPVACIQSDSGCTCYTEQATPVAVPDTQCRSYVENGIYNPYKARQETADNLPQGSYSGEGGASVLTLDSPAKPTMAHAETKGTMAQ